MTAPNRDGPAIDPKLSPDDAVVIFGDIQTSIVQLPLTVPSDELLRSAKGLATLAEIFDMPTLAMTIPKYGGGESVVVPEITKTRSKYTHLQRTAPDSFQNTAIREWINATGRGTLVVCGIATEIVVQWLVLSGLANGYKVHVIVDACGGLGERSEEAALRRFVAAGATLSSLVSLAGELSGDFTRPIGREAIEVVYRHILRQ